MGKRRRSRDGIEIRHPGSLKRLGYDPDYSDRARHAALARAVRRYGYRKTMQKLNAVAVLTKRSNPKYHRIYEEDKDWLREKFGRRGRRGRRR